jgi:AMP phosphorylase
MILKVKSLKLLAGRPIAILHANTAKKLALYPGERISIKKGSQKIIAIIDVAKGILHENEAALSVEIINYLKLKESEKVEISVAPKLMSIYYILEKLKGKELSYDQIYRIITDIVNNALTEAEIAYFVSAIFINGMSMDETVMLIKAMVKNGRKLNIKNVVDKHSIGGVAGNRTTPIIVSICSSAGLTMPKTSSKAITSAAGTADVIEVLTKVEFSVEEIKKIIKKVNACIVWGGALGLAPADDKIIQVERLISLDPEAQLIASILSKKLAVNAKYILLDIPYGKSAKVSSKEEAEKLAKKFKTLAKIFNLKLNTVLTDGSEPIGNGIGPVLEARDVISVLSRAKGRPLDLEKKALQLSAIILEMTGKAKKGAGFDMAKKILDSKLAYKKFKQIIDAQNGGFRNIEEKLQLAKFSFKIKAKKNARIVEIDNKKVSQVARAAGCPADKPAGIYLHVHKGFKVKKGEDIATIYAETREKLDFSVELFKKINPVILK